MVAAAAVTEREMNSFLKTLWNTLHSQPAIRPSKIRHPSAIHRLFATPGNPSVVIKGENAKARRPGAVVLAQIEHRPNRAPSTAPALGPRRIAPRITGMCMVVALITGKGIKPIPVIPITSSTPHSIASMAI